MRLLIFIIPILIQKKMKVDDPLTKLNEKLLAEMLRSVQRKDLHQ